MNRRCFHRYVHTLNMLYGSRGIALPGLEASLPSVERVAGLGPEKGIELLFPAIRARVSAFDGSLAGEFLEQPTFREVELLGRRVVWPILTRQGLEWYGAAPLETYDYLAEARMGLHEGGRVFYDFGGHHGIWALYYSLVAGPTGRVYSFEPSVINVEMSALLQLVNGVENIVTIGLALVPSGDRGSHSDMLVDFVPRESLLTVGLREVCWDRGDFLKMDIEGYEYDLLTRDPWIFDLATHMHIELHIPHLERRGLDYRRVMEVIPFDRFDVFNHMTGEAVFFDTPLQGYCSLLFRRRHPGVPDTRPA